jgi:hypothetical protein
VFRALQQTTLAELVTFQSPGDADSRPSVLAVRPPAATV